MKHGDLVPRATRVASCLLCLTLGVPAQSIAQTPQLLRAPERLMSEADCSALLKHVNFLKDPGYARQLRGTLASLEKMRAQAEQGKWDADRRLWEELQQRSREFIDDLKDHALKGMVEEAQNAQYRALIRSMHARGVLPASPSLVWLKKVQDRTRELIFKLDKLGKVANRGGEVYREALTDAASANSSALEAHEYLERELLSEPALKGYAEELLAALKGSRLLPPYYELGFKLGYLAVTAVFPAWERFVMAPGELANLQVEIDKMRSALQRIELDLAMDQRRYQRYCVERPVQQAQASPKPVAPPAAPHAASPSTGMGAVLIGLGVAGAAAAAASLAGGSGDSASPGSSGGCQAGSHSCQGSASNKCCPNGFTIHCNNTGTCTNATSANFGNVCGNQSAAAPCGH